MEITQLETRIREKLASVSERTKKQQEQVARRMAEIEQLQNRFEQTAQRLFKSIILPRIGKLAACFDNAHLLEPDHTIPHHCVCRFDHTAAFPVTARLELGLCPDGELNNIIALYNLEILPVLSQFEGKDLKEFPVEDVDEQRLAEWVDQKILDFVDTYLTLPEKEEYQKHGQNLVTDPVCGMELNRLQAAAQMDYQGRTYYFCVDDCRQKFEKDPGRYVRQRWGKVSTAH